MSDGLESGPRTGWDSASTRYFRRERGYAVQLRVREQSGETIF